MPARIQRQKSSQENAPAFSWGFLTFLYFLLANIDGLDIFRRASSCVFLEEA